MSEKLNGRHASPKRRSEDRDYRWLWIGIVFAAMLASLWGTFQ